MTRSNPNDKLFCSDCMDLLNLLGEKNDTVGICNGQKSDHYEHVIGRNHPCCPEIKLTSEATKIHKEIQMDALEERKRAKVDNSFECPTCRKKLSPGTERCPYCHLEISFCVFCGKVLYSQAYTDAVGKLYCNQGCYDEKTKESSGDDVDDN